MVGDELAVSLGLLFEVIVVIDLCYTLVHRSGIGE